MTAPNIALRELSDTIIACRRCPRLVDWREQITDTPKARSTGDHYWARPVPGFGDPAARLYVLGLATSAHGGNRTGRAFTGNRTADWLMPAMHRAGLASQPTSTDREDGLVLHGAWMGSAVRCPPPANRPTPAERDACLPYLASEIQALTDLRVILALGAFAWAAALRLLDRPPRPRFGHGAQHLLPGGAITLLGSYHPSQQNTTTGVLTREMLDNVLQTASTLASSTP